MRVTYNSNFVYSVFCEDDQMKLDAVVQREYWFDGAYFILPRKVLFVDGTEIAAFGPMFEE